MVEFHGSLCGFSESKARYCIFNAIEDFQKFVVGPNFFFWIFENDFGFPFSPLSLVILGCAISPKQVWFEQGAGTPLLNVFLFFKEKGKYY